MAKPAHVSKSAHTAERTGGLRRGRARPRWHREQFVGGGSDGNERLTVVTGVILFVLLAVIGVTIVRIHQLISVHLFLGLVLVAPVVLKMASTGYRFVRYYADDPVYRRKGPPELGLRVIAPVVVLTTVVVFVSGVVLLFQGPDRNGPLRSIHKVSFIVWLVFMAVHVLGHVPEMLPLLRSGRWADAELAELHDPEIAELHDAEIAELQSGRAGRTIALAGALVGGLVLAVVLLPQFAAWTQQGAFGHH